MNFVKNVVVWILFGYVGFMTGYFLSHPKEVKVEPEPMTDWAVFYNRLFLHEWQVTFTIGLTCDNNGKCDYDLYFVDGDKWIKFEYEGGQNTSLRGCGAPQAVYRRFVLIDENFKKNLTSVPSKNAKIVAVGTSNIKVVESGVRYVNRGKMDN